MNGAPQLFFSCRAPAVAGPAHGARARHPASRRAKKSTGAGRVPVRRSELVRCRVQGKQLVRVRPSRFFLAGRRNLDRPKEEHALAGAGPCEFVLWRPCFGKQASGGAASTPYPGPRTS